METTQMPIIKTMTKQIVVYSLYNGLFSLLNRKKQTTNEFYNIDKSHRHYAEWIKPTQRQHTPLIWSAGTELI